MPPAMLIVGAWQNVPCFRATKKSMLLACRVATRAQSAPTIRNTSKASHFAEELPSVAHSVATLHAQTARLSKLPDRLSGPCEDFADVFTFLRSPIASADTHKLELQFLRSTLPAVIDAHLTALTFIPVPRLQRLVTDLRRQLQPGALYPAALLDFKTLAALQSLRDVLKGGKLVVQDLPIVRTTQLLITSAEELELAADSRRTHSAGSVSESTPDASALGQVRQRRSRAAMCCAIFLAHTALGLQPPAPLMSALHLDSGDPRGEVSWEKAPSSVSAGQRPHYDVRISAAVSGAVGRKSAAVSGSVGRKSAAVAGSGQSLRLQPPAAVPAGRVDGILSAFQQQQVTLLVLAMLHYGAVFVARGVPCSSVSYRLVAHSESHGSARHSDRSEGGFTVPRAAHPAGDVAHIAPEPAAGANLSTPSIEPEAEAVQPTSPARGSIAASIRMRLPWPAAAGAQARTSATAGDGVVASATPSAADPASASSFVPHGLTVDTGSLSCWAWLTNTQVELSSEA